MRAVTPSWCPYFLSARFLQPLRKVIGDRLADPAGQRQQLRGLAVRDDPNLFEPRRLQLGHQFRNREVASDQPLRLAGASALEVEAEPSCDRKATGKRAIGDEEERVAVVDHRHNLSSGLADAYDLRERLVHVGRVGDDAPVEHQVERSVSEGKRLRVPLEHLSVELERGEPEPRRLDPPSRSGRQR